jgi:hypothetical protein
MKRTGGAPVSTIYCPYTDRDIPLSETSPEHIIPLALGGMNGFTIPVSRDFNSRVGSEIDGALANDFLVMSKRDKHGVKGHSKKHPQNVIPNAKNAETGEPLHVTMGQVHGLRLWDPKLRKDVTGQGQKVSIGFQVDLDVTLRFVAKVALSAGYLVYGDRFRTHVKHEDLRKIMNYRPTEMGELLGTIEAHYDDRFLEPQSDNQKIFRAIASGFGPHSVIALICTQADCPVHHPKTTKEPTTNAADSAKWKAEQDRQRRDEAISNTTGIRVLAAIGSAVPVRLMKRDLLFVVERLAGMLDENRLAIVAKQHGIKKAKDDDSVAKMFAAYLRRAEESALGRITVELTIVLAASRSNPPQVLKDAAAVYKVDTDAIASKVKQEFAAKQKAKKATPVATPKPPAKATARPRQAAA